MMDVVLTYNAYRSTMRIVVDNQPLNNVSSLTKYQSMPFASWCGEILKQIGREINDDYTLTYVGRACESHVLAMLSTEVQACRGFRTRAPVIGDSTAKRLRKLHQLCTSGLQFQQFTETLVIYTDQEPEMVEPLFRAELPKLCYCRMRLQICPLEELANDIQGRLRYIIADRRETEAIRSVVKNLPGESYAMLLSRENRFCGANGCVMEEVTPETLKSAVASYLEMGFFIKLLPKAMERVSIDSKNVDYPAFMALDKTEPQTYARLPSSIETGQSISVELYTVPEGYPVDSVQYRVSNTEILEIRDNVIHCIGTGTTVVEVYVAGQSVCISRGQIVAHRRNRITSMTLSSTVLRMAVGDKTRLSVSYLPKDADNVSMIRYRSEDGTIASAIDGVVLARSPGSTRIRVSTENGVGGTCSVEVFPKLERIEASLGSTHLPFNGITSVQVRRVPENATLDPLIFTVYPENIAVFDRSGMNLAARSFGDGRLVITDSRKSVESVLEFTIRPAPAKITDILKILVWAGIVIAVILLIIKNM